MFLHLCLEGMGISHLTASRAPTGPKARRARATASRARTAAREGRATASAGPTVARDKAETRMGSRAPTAARDKAETHMGSRVPTAAREEVQVAEAEEEEATAGGATVLRVTMSQLWLQLTVMFVVD